MEKLIKRNQQLAENTWDTSVLFTSDDEWKSFYSKTKTESDILSSYAGKISKSPKELYDYLILREKFTKDVMRIYCYAMLKSDEDKSNSNYVDFYGRAISLFTDISGKISFETPEIISVSDTELESFYKELPALCEFRRFFDMIRAAKAHTLSTSEEALLAMAGEISETPDNVASQFRNADLRFPDITDADGNKRQVTQGSFVPLMESSDVNVRRQAFESVYHTYDKYKNTVASLIDAQIKQLTFFRKARKFDSNIQKALFANEVPVSVYDNLVKSVNDHLPAMHKYMALRKRLMHLDEMHMYDLYTPIIADVDSKYTFEEAKSICRSALAPLGEDYLAILDEGFSNRWIDIYENEGKRGGAYSMGTPTHPFVLLNHKDTLDSMFTLIHEMGHAIHSYLSKKNQREIYNNYVIFVAEVASTFNESMLMQYLLKNTTDKKQRAYLINHFLEEFRTTLYRQTMFAEFERDINALSEAGQSLTADTLNDIYYKLNCKYYGDSVCIDKEIALEWARIPHFFMNFYVYQYATGYSAAVALSEKVLSEGGASVDNYKKFLSGGCIADPITLLKGAGVDMSSTKPVDDALELFDHLIDELDELMK